MTGSATAERALGSSTAGSVPFIRLVGAELGKIASQRSQRWLVLVAVMIAPIAAIIFCVSLPVTQGSSLAETAAGDVLSATMLGVDAATIATIVFAASAVGTEYTTGMIVQSLAVIPNRARLLAAKTAAVGIVTMAIGIAAVALAGMVAGIAVASTGRGFGEIVADSGWRLLAGTIVMPVFYGLLAVSFAFLLRSTPAGIIGPIAVLVLAAIVGWFGADIGEAITPLTPLAGLHSISGIATGAEDIGPLAGTIVVAAWLLVGYLIALWRFSRRDA